MIKFNYVYKYFQSGNKEKVEILKNVDLELGSGKWYSIIGTSGVGKSTLLNIMAGLLEPDEGSVVINNTNIYELKDSENSSFRRHNIGFVFQDFKLISHYSVLDNVILPLIHEQKKDILIEKAKYLLEEVGITQNMLRRSPDVLSGGEKQRVAIARALIADPQILLCDEPTGNLDIKTRDIIINILMKIKDKGHTIIVVTHDMDVAKKGDCIYKIVDGTVLKEEGQQAIYNH